MADGPHYQDIKRGLVTPPFRAAELAGEVQNVERAYSQLAQEVTLCHNRVYVDQIVVAPGLLFLAVVLPTPYPDTNYSPLCILDWAAFGHVTAIATTGFTITFSVVSPAITGGVMRVIVIR